MAKKVLAKVENKEDGQTVEENQLKCPSDQAGQEAPQAELGAQQLTEAPQPSVTTTQSTKSRASGAPTSVCIMHKVLTKKAQGKKIKVRYNRIGVPVGQTRHKLQSYIGMLARNMVPIDILSWPKVSAELKQKLWTNIQDTFKVTPESRKLILQSAGAKWRQFKSILTSDHVMPYIRQKKKLLKPPRQYAFVGKENWKRFVAERITDD